MFEYKGQVRKLYLNEYSAMPYKWHTKEMYMKFICSSIPGMVRGTEKYDIRNWLKLALSPIVLVFIPLIALYTMNRYTKRSINADYGKTAFMENFTYWTEKPVLYRDKENECTLTLTE